MLTYQDLVDLFLETLQRHGSEKKAYKDVEYISEEANKETSLVMICDAYDEAVSLWRKNGH